MDKKNPSKPGIKKPPPSKTPLILWLAIFTVLFFTLNYYRVQKEPESEITYDTFIRELKADNLATVRIRGEIIRGELKKESYLMEEKEGQNSFLHFRTLNPFSDDSTLQKRLEEHNVRIIAEPETNFWTNWLLPILPLFLILGLFWFFFYRQMQGAGKGVMSFGKSKAKLVMNAHPEITFADVAGADESKQELEEIVSFLKEPKKFTRLGAKIPKGVLLVGPPGCGKTLLAKAVAGEANVPFYSLSGSDFVELFVGVGASRVRDLFEQGKKSAAAGKRGCIIFIDEIDAVGRQRFAGIGGGHDEREQTLNQLLVEMDGFDPNIGVILVAATNRPDVLDPALLRPGRFDRRIEVYTPDINGREAILKVHTKNVKLAKNINLKTIAKSTPGFSGADLANLINEAALLAARRNRNKIHMKDLDDARERIIAGPERKSRVIGQKEKKMVAYHEAGHAILAHLIPETDPLHKVSIIPRGGMALGYTMQLPPEDRYLVTKTELLGRITVYLGGRVAEKLIFNEETTGGQNDLETVSRIARKMVLEFGMSENMGPLTYRHDESEVFLGRDISREKAYSEKVAVDIDREVHGIVDKCFSRAKNMLEANRDKLDKLADVLLAREILSGEEAEAIIEGKHDSGEKTGRSKNGHKEDAGGGKVSSGSDGRKSR
jgi:cell division protease FtsH